MPTGALWHLGSASEAPLMQSFADLRSAARMKPSIVAAAVESISGTAEKSMM
jgi:hypothetical protein